MCRATGADVKITREHTFPNWINDVLPRAVVGPDITYERSIQHGPQAGTVRTWPAAQVAGHTLRAVCQNCNSGWMAQLEGAARPVITPMIKGETSALTTEQQITVATWAAMKAAVFEYVWTGDPILTAADREVIMTQNRPPARVQVRLAAVESDGYPLQVRGLGYETRGTSDTALCLTLAVGCLVAQVFAEPGAATQGLRFSGTPGADFIRIYPPDMQAVRWPPPQALDDQTLVAFADPLAALTGPSAEG
jgi:hypothetical protein